MTHRKSEKIPAYDCRMICLHEPKGNHGQSCEKWRFCVISDDMKSAVSLRVYSGLYLDPDMIVENERSSRRIWGDQRRFYRTNGGDLSLHVAWRTELEQVRTNHPFTQCDLIDKCTSPWSTGIGAHEFWEKHAAGEFFEQPELFWLELENVLKDRAPEYPDIDLTHEQCLNCLGQGVIERKEKLR